MGDEAFTWVIKKFSTLQSGKIYSDPFVIGGCRWSLLAYPKGFHKDNNLSLYLNVVDIKSLPSGWRRHVKFSFTIVNQSPEKNSKLRETSYWYDNKEGAWGFPEMLSFSKLHAKDSGFLVNDQLKIVAAVNVLEVIGKLDVSEESQPLKKAKIEDDVNWIYVQPSQMEFVKSLCKKHPDIALEFSSKNTHLSTGYMNVLLSLTRKLCQSPQALSNGDISSVGAALTYLTNAGFELDWLEKKFVDLKENKKKEEGCLAQLQEMEEELKPLKQKCLDLEGQMDKKKAELLEARVPISFDDLIS